MAAGISEQLKQQLSAVCSTEYLTANGPEIPFEYVDRAELIIIRSPYWISPYCAENARDLKVVVRAGSGTDGLCVDILTRRGIRVHCIQMAGLSVAEHAFALLLSAARNIPELNATTRSGEWKKSEAQGIELYGKSIAIIGFGNIGQRVAQIAAGFGLRTVITDPSLWKAQKTALLHQIPNIEDAPLERALALADFVVLCCPLNSHTRNMIGFDALSIMKPTAILVNIARAEIIDRDALAATLAARRLTAVCLDVHYNEPQPDASLMQNDRVFATPHIGAQTMEARNRIEQEVLNLVRDYALGSP